MIDDSDNPLFVVPVAEPLKERQWSDAARNATIPYLDA
jgi:hypothetical protein